MCSLSRSALSYRTAGFAERLKHIREAHGMTACHLAQLAGLRQQTVLNLEQPGSDPQLSLLLRLTRALEVPVMALVPDANQALVNSNGPAGTKTGALAAMPDQRPIRRREVLPWLLVGPAFCLQSAGLALLIGPGLGFAVFVVGPPLFLVMVLIAAAIWVNWPPPRFKAGSKADSSKQDP
jgi:transcriptional regulator with XRE-family HTH domain